MKKIVLFNALLFCVNFFFYGQKNEFEVRKQDVIDFPTVKGNLWVRNPNGIETASVKFYENETPVNVSFQNYTVVDSLSKNKSVVFLILNTPNKSEFEWYKKVIKDAIRKGAILKGDKIEIISFSCKQVDQLLFPNEIEFTDNADELFREIDAIKINSRTSSCSNRSHIYLSIHEALELYEKQNLNIPSAIFVLADDCALMPISQAESPGARSARLNIPIYGISYFKQKTFFDIEDLCKQTFGLYYRNENNDINQASDTLLNYLSNLNQRSAGLIYPFTYTSTFEKDGEVHPVKIETKSGQSGFALLTPSKNIIEWIEANLILSIILFILLVGIIIVLFQIVKKNKLKKIELEIQQKKQMSEMERQHFEADIKLNQQESELNRIREEEKLKQENEFRLEQERIQKYADEEQLRKMLERGNLPWFEYRLGDETGQHQVSKPRFKVGRDASNTWVINHPTVSRNHFELTFTEYIYTIKDLGSSNGIEVNGLKVNELQLNHGDYIQLGDISLTFHI
jgi:hypothetical protein